MSTILIAGGTGNTGVGAVRTLSKLLSGDKPALGGSIKEILVLTRSASGAAAQELAKLPLVRVEEKLYISATPEYLKQNKVRRIYAASPPSASQFAEETSLYAAALAAGVEYVVRIGTGASVVRPDFLTFYPRNHWAIEQVLASPEYAAMHASSLNPSAFNSVFLGAPAQYIRAFRETGRKPDELRLVMDESKPHAVIDPAEIGAFAAHLLVTDDPAATKSHYTIHGPKDITGRQVVDLVERYVGSKVDKVTYRDMSGLDAWVEASPPDQKPYIATVRHSFTAALDSAMVASATSPEVLKLAPPKRGPEEILEELVNA